MDLLATTNRGLESVASAEVTRLTGAESDTHHPGWIAFEGTPDEIATLNVRARTLHRVLVSLVDQSATGLADIQSLTEAVPIAEYVDSGQAIAVESTRIGTHDFESPEVASVVGQAVRDSHEAATGDSLPVDLDDPDVVFRAVVRHDRFTLALDTTGARSLHRRPYYVREHEAPVRPTMAATLLDIADVDAETSVVDPFCGSGTIPIEAALAARGMAPNAAREDFAFEVLPFVPDDALARVRESIQPRAAGPRIVGADTDREALSGARENAREAGVDIELLAADARRVVPDADAVVTDLPFNIRTNHGDLRPLYREFCAAVEASTADRLVALTARPDLLPVEADRTITFRDGRLDLAIVVASV